MAKGDSREKILEKEAQRRLLRSKYVEIRSRIDESKNEMTESGKFIAIVNEVEILHQHVEKPREQVADAEALLDLSSTLVDSAKLQTGGISPSDFVSSLYRHFGVQNGSLLSRNGSNLLLWKDIGIDVSHIFKNARGCFTMIGPMSIQIKRRKFAVRRRRYAWLGARARPQKVHNYVVVQTDTEKNIHTMFEILKKKYPVKLEHLILNRHSFSQTVENLFALSFLVKDGRVVIQVDQTSSHLISPMNAPPSKLVMSGKVKNSQFIFRLDFSDWKLMVGLVPEGEELMPNRGVFNNSNFFQGEPVPESNTTPVDILRRNCVNILKENIIAEDKPENCGTTTAKPNCKRKLHFP